MSINKEWFIQKIKDFLLNDKSNKMTQIDNSFFYEPDPIVGFVSGNDPIFKEYKNIISESHLTPQEIFEWYCSENAVNLNLENLTVIAYVLPINRLTKKENFIFSEEMPSERWAQTRLFGEEANINLQKILVKELKNLDIHAVAPMIEKKLFKINRKLWVSNWSFRHICFAAGMGSFGLSDGFINEKGIAMRCGSIVINYKLPSDADQRPSDPYEYCTKCGKCIKRCPVGAINLEKGHDKQICSQKVMSTIPYNKKNYNITVYACGLCQVGVPCQDGIPSDSNQ